MEDVRTVPRRRQAARKGARRSKRRRSALFKKQEIAGSRRTKQALGAVKGTAWTSP